jgi:NitT/TauT family transport system permease protein
VTSSTDLRAETEKAATASPVQQATGATKPRRRSRRLFTADWRVQLGRLAVLIAALGLWYVAVEQEWIKPLYAAGPVDTLKRLGELLTTASFYRDLWVTMQATLGGWFVGAVLGLLVGVALGRLRRTSQILEPYLTFANATPKIALAPFFILWFGIGVQSKAVLAATIVFFIVQVPTRAAVSLVNPDLELVTMTMGATEVQKFFKVVLPGIAPAVFGALRLGAVYSLLGVVMGEFIAAKEGLGQKLITATNQFDMATAFSLLIVLASLAVMLNGVVGVAERRVLRWRTTDQTNQPVRL